MTGTFLVNQEYADYMIGMEVMHVLEGRNIFYFKGIGRYQSFLVNIAVMGRAELEDSVEGEQDMNEEEGQVSMQKDAELVTDETQGENDLKIKERRARTRDREDP